jgi:uncharacterized membrane protein
MKPLVVLITAFIIAAIILKLIDNHLDFAFAARIGMAAMLLFTAIGHFAFTKGMAMMVPKAVPFKEFMVYLTGLFEILAAAGLLLNSYYRVTGYTLIVFFLVMLPANIYAAIKHIDYQKGTTDGPGLKYLWFRVPLQVLFIAWVYVAAILS